MQAAFVAVLALLATTAFAQNCTDQIQQFEFPLPRPVVWRHMSGESVGIPPSECGGRSYCNYVNKFTCVDVEQSFAPVECAEAYLEGLFPLCIGQVIIDARCSTWDCCNNLNKQAYSFVASAWGNRAIDFNYQMLYFSSSLPIKCQSFSPGEYNQCYQWIEYGASSNWDECLYLQKQYDQSADNMAFSLF